MSYLEHLSLEENYLTLSRVRWTSSFVVPGSQCQQYTGATWLQGGPALLTDTPSWSLETLGTVKMLLGVLLQMLTWPTQQNLGDHPPWGDGCHQKRQHRYAKMVWNRAAEEKAALQAEWLLAAHAAPLKVPLSKDKRHVAVSLSEWLPADHSKLLPSPAHSFGLCVDSQLSSNKENPLLVFQSCGRGCAGHHWCLTDALVGH